MAKSFLLVAALLGTLGLARVAWSLSSSPSPRPVAVIRQPQVAAKNVDMPTTSAAVSFNGADTSIQNDTTLLSLQNIDEYSKRIYSPSGAQDWGNTETNLSLLQQEAQCLNEQMSENSAGIRQLNTNVDQLQQSVVTEDWLFTQQAAHQATLSVAK